MFDFISQIILRKSVVLKKNFCFPSNIGVWRKKITKLPIQSCITDRIICNDEKRKMIVAQKTAFPENIVKMHNSF